MKFYIIVLFNFALFTVFAQAPSDYFITKWDLSKQGTAGNNSLVFPITTTGVVNYNWETVPAGATGTGTISGTTATITGLPVNAIVRLYIEPANFKSINFLGTGLPNELRLIDVEQWGTVNWTTMYYAFDGCSNLNINATDIPNLSGISDMQYMFSFCQKLTGPININLWNTSTITNMQGLFFYANLFNQPIGNWNVSNVTDMSLMFAVTSVFDQSIANWDVSNVTTMEQMFDGATSFNQPIENWNTSSLTNTFLMFSYSTSFNQPLANWDVSKVTTMRLMFQRTLAFNQPIENWDVSNVTDLAYMFREAISFNQPLNNWNTTNVNYINMMFFGATAFNQNIGNWTFNPNVNMANMLDNSGMDCNNYTDTLIGWSNNPNTPNNRNLGALGMDYGMNALPNRDILISGKGWTIIGDTQSTGNCGTLAIDDFSTEKTFEIYPNPAEGFIFVNTEEKGIGKIFNSLGQTLKLINLEDNKTIDVSDLPTGIYILQFKSNGINYCKKIIKK